MKFLFLIVFIVSLLSSSEPLSQKIKTISKSKTWLKLLHYNNNQSSITSKNFFLSKNGDKNPLLELQITLKHFKNQKSICKYPARYVFLSTYFDLLDKRLISKDCKDLLKWNIIKDTSSISLVFVSGFLGNPASAFGHSFLKINKINNTNLFNTTISYGAKVPKKNNIFLYIANGLTGGYKATYSDKYFYMDEMVYSNNEFREMWEHKLSLNDKQKEMLLYHLWELKGVRFDYYFLNRNCGYKISELLDIVFKKPMIDSAYVWYAPIETFYKLKDVTSEIIYYPSQQQKIYAQFDSLSVCEKIISTQTLQNKSKIIPPKYKDINISSKVKIVDFLINFQKYKTNKIPYSLLMHRMSLPLSKYRNKKPKEKKPAVYSDRLSSFGINVNRHQAKNGLHLSFSTFLIDKIGVNTLDGDMMSVGNGKITVNKDKIKLNEFDFIKIRRLKINRLPLDKEKPISWNLSLGYEENQKFFINAGVGYSWKFFDKHKFYVMINSLLQSKKENILLNPNIGLFINNNKFKMNFEFGEMKNNKVNKLYYDIESQYSYFKNKSLYLKFSNKYKEDISMGLKWFF